MKRINILFIFIFSVPSATFSQQSHSQRGFHVPLPAGRRS